MNVTLHGPGTVPPASDTPAAPPTAPQALPATQTPSEQVALAANVIRYVTDASGRTIGWRALSALEDFDLSEISGGNSTNQDWMMYATIAFGVRQIDQEQVARPINKNQLRAMVARLGHPGIAAVLTLFPRAAEDVVDPEAGEKERAKN